MSAVPQPTNNSARKLPLWQRPPLRSVPAVPDIDPSRVIDIKQYDELLLSGARKLSLKKEEDRLLIQTMFGVIERMTEVWQNQGNLVGGACLLYKKVAIDVYARTGEVLHHGLINTLWASIKQKLKHNLKLAMQESPSSPEDVEAFLWRKLWYYGSIRFFRSQTQNVEAKLRASVDANTPTTSRKRPTNEEQTPLTVQKKPKTSGGDQPKERKPMVFSIPKPVPIPNSGSSGLVGETSRARAPVRTEPQAVRLSSANPEPQAELFEESQRLGRSIKPDPEGVGAQNPEAGQENQMPVVQEEDNDIIELDIGGALFRTYKSMLKEKSGWFRKRLGAQTKMFINRDWAHFRVILNYMRSGGIRLPDKEKEIEEIQEEAFFYEMAELIGLCALKLRKMKGQ